MSNRRIRNKDEFEKLMQEVDKELCKKSIPIPGREIAALGEVAKFFGTSLFGGPLSTGPVPGVYEGESLSAHVFQWIQNRYGNRLKIEFKNGLSIILLRGDPWLGISRVRSQK